MVAAMSRGKKAYVQYETQLSDAIARLAQLREELKSAIDADAESYNAVMKAYKAAKESSDGGAAINAALRQATSVPLGVAERAAEVAQIAETLKPITNPNMASDLITAVALAKAAMTGALANVADQSGVDEGRFPEDDAFMKQTRARAANWRRYVCGLSKLAALRAKASQLVSRFVGSPLKANRWRRVHFHLLARDWMLRVPRSKEHCENIHFVEIGLARLLEPEKSAWK